MINLKKIMYYVGFLLVALPSEGFSYNFNNQGRLFTITGAAQWPSGLIALEYFDGNVSRFDTANLHKGKFFFKGTLSEASRAKISILNGRFPNDNMSNNRIYEFSFILEPIDLTIELDTSLAIPIVGGSQAQIDFFKSASDKLAIAYESILLSDQMIELIGRQQAGDSSRSLQERISTLSEALMASQERNREKLLKLDAHFIDSHPASILSAFLIEDNRTFLSTDSTLLLYNKLDNNVRSTSLGKRLLSRIKAAKNSAVGKQAPDFTSEDSKGNVVRLSDFLGHYVLLDFWASWCAPCRQMTPEIKKLYNQYQLKLKVISISLDFHKDDWKKALKEDNIGGWVNLWENGYVTQKESDIMYSYNIQAIPAFVLIDEKGKIIWRGQSLSAPAEIKQILMNKLE